MMFLIKMAIRSSRAPRTSSRGTARVAARPVSHGPDATGGGHRMGTSPRKGWNWWNRPSHGDIMRYSTYTYTYIYIYVHIYIIYYIKRTTWFLGTLPYCNQTWLTLKSPKGYERSPAAITDGYLGVDLPISFPHQQPITWQCVKTLYPWWTSK